MQQILRFAGLMAAFCLCVKGQEPAKDALAAPANETKGFAPRATPADYPSQGKAGSVTIAADFRQHSIPLLEGILTTENFIVVEAAFFGAPDARLKLSLEDFSLRINGKKTPVMSQPVDFIAGNVKDPEWEPPAAPESKGSKTKLNAGGGGGNDDAPPPPPKMPLELRRAMVKRVQAAAMPLGDRPLPQAGFLFFDYGSSAKNIKTIELIYSGPAGKTTIALQP
ncbi:MAG TPA: hypothetical protein VGN17_05465 [Bryobacteraceae bacterium]|jgi:hypothetical protein